MTRARALPFRTAILCPSARSRSWRGLNSLYTASRECYHDDENDENAKGDQFSCNHTRLPECRPVPRRPTKVVSATSQRTRLANQASGGARGASGSARRAFRNAFGGSAENAPGERSGRWNQARPARGRGPGTKLPPPSFIRLARTAAEACVAGDDSATELPRPPSAPCQSGELRRFPTRQMAVAIAITISRMQQRFGTSSQYNGTIRIRI